MLRKIRLYLLVISALSCVLIFSFGCTQESGEATLTAEEQAEKDAAVQEDFTETMNVHNTLTSDEEKFELWKEFLARNSNGSYTVGTIEYLAMQHYIKRLDDPEGALAFAKEKLADLTDERFTDAGKRLIFALYAETGNKEEIRNMATAIEKPTIRECMNVADAGMKVEDWDLVKEFSQRALEMNTAETIQAEDPDTEMTDEQIQNSIKRTNAGALTNLGWAQMNMDEIDAAVETFAKAEPSISFNYAGVTWGDFSNYQTKALLKKGDYATAKEKIAPAAITMGDKKAVELYKEAYLATGGIEADFAGHVEEMRSSIARTMPEFQAFDYEGNKVDYGTVKGKVTLLAFWFPT